MAKKKQYLIGQPCIEATAKMLLVPQRCDVKGADPRDPRNCILARCARRTYGVKSAYFFRKISYFEMPDKNGVVKLVRFVNPAATTRFIERFDKIGERRALKEFVGKAIEFWPVTPGRTREALRKQYRKLVKAGRIGGGKSIRKPLNLHMSLRPGTGMISFPHQITA